MAENLFKGSEGEMMSDGDRSTNPLTAVKEE